MSHFGTAVRWALVVVGAGLCGSASYAQAQNEDGHEPAAAASDHGPEAAEPEGGGEGASESDVPTTALERSLNGLREERAALEDLRQRVRAAHGNARELLLPKLEDERAHFRRRLVEVADRLRGDEPLEGSEATLQQLEATLKQQLGSETGRLRGELTDEVDILRKTLSQVDKIEGDELAALRAEQKAALGRMIVRISEVSDMRSAREQLGDDLTPDDRWLPKYLESSSTFISGALRTTAQSLERLESVTAPDAELEQRIADVTGDRELLAELQAKNLELMDALGLETARLRQDLIRSTGKLSGDVLDAEVTWALLRDWRSDAGDWLSENATSLLFRGVGIVLILLFSWAGGRAARWLARRALTHSRASALAKDFAAKMAGRVVLAIGVVVALSQLGVEIGPLLAGLGIAGFVIGFALQDTLSNFASGMMILMYRPFDVGDVVEAGGVMGTVREMSLVSTAIVTFDNQMLIVPNRKIWGDVIRNVTHQAERRVDLVFGIGYDDDVDHAEAVLNDIVAQNPRVLEEPRPLVRLHELADSSVNFVVRPWVKTSDYWDAYWEITREVKRRFDAEGISIPFPQRDMHIYEERVERRVPAVSDVAPAPRVRQDTDDTAHSDDSAEG